MLAQPLNTACSLQLYITDILTSLISKLLYALMDEFKYEPLNLEKPAIRLLSLHPGNGNMTISCELFQAELHQRQNMVSYEALSYTWGSPHLPQKIRVNGFYFKITRNLYSALRDLRFQDRQRVLWIDAVCIDQKNDKERGHQVGQMGDIYKEADNVIFRLGLGSAGTDLFMENLQWLQKESIQHACRAWSRQDSRWEDLWTSFRPLSEEPDVDPAKLQRQGLHEILTQHWFRRVWILQEVAFAKAAIISCGKKSVSARLFGLAPLLLGITPNAHCQSVLDIMPSPWRESTWWSESRSFYKLISSFGGSNATDPRDLVYALRGMASDLADKDKPDDPLFPDYQKSQGNLVRDVIQYIYGFDVSNLELAPRLSSMQELVINLPRLETDIFRHLAEMSQPEHMERILKRPEILYDKDGKVVNVLLRCRGREFKLDDDVLVCAAANLNAAEAVFEAFRFHQNQPIITEQTLIAAANAKYGPSPMRLAPILLATARNTSEISKKEIIELLLQQNDFSNDTVSEVLAATAEIHDYDLQKEIIRTLLQQNDFSNDTVSEVLAAAAEIRDYDLQNEIIRALLWQKDFSNDTASKVLTATAEIHDYDLQKEIIELLLQQNDFSNDTVSEVLAAAAEIRDYDLQNEIIRTLLWQKDCWNDTIPEVFAAASRILDYDLKGEIIKTLLQKKNSSEINISEVITAVADIRDINLQIEIIGILLEQKSVSFAEKIYKALLKRKDIKDVTITKFVNAALGLSD
ncbi:heterokaryon incompatibility domain-containing protein [Trichoderma sp. SZMC 28012]